MFMKFLKLVKFLHPLKLFQTTLRAMKKWKSSSFFYHKEMRQNENSRNPQFSDQNTISMTEVHPRDTRWLMISK